MRISSIYTAGIDFRELERVLPPLNSLGCLPLKRVLPESSPRNALEQTASDERDITVPGTALVCLPLSRPLSELPLRDAMAESDAGGVTPSGTALVVVPEESPGTPAVGAAATDAESERFLSGLAGTSVVYVDTETTGLTPDSKPVQTRLRVPADTRLRLRVLTLGYECGGKLETRVFDLDKVSVETTRHLLTMVLRKKVLVGHNITFDLNWMRHTCFQITGETPDCPEYALDTLLLVRLIRPKVSASRGGFRLNDLFEDMYTATTRRDAETLLEDGCAASPSGEDDNPDTEERENDSSASRSLDKQYQKPANWVVPDLSPEALAYAKMDVVALHAWLRFAADIQGSVADWVLRFVDAPVSTLQAFEFASYDQTEDTWSRVDTTVSTWLQIPRILSDWFLRGQPFSENAVLAYEEQEKIHLEECVTRLLDAYPELAVYREDFLNMNAGIRASLRQFLGEFLEGTLNVRVARTERTQAYKIGVKDLRGAEITRNPDALVFYQEWKSINEIKKLVKMAKTYLRFSRRDARIHPLFSPATATARLSCSEPNMQQVPGEKVFRAFITRGEGHKIIASDVSALDVRVGAALAVRTQQELRFSKTGDGLSTQERVQGILNDFCLHPKEIRPSSRRYLEDVWDKAIGKANNPRKPYSLQTLIRYSGQYDERLQGIPEEDSPDFQDSLYDFLDSRRELQEMRLANALWSIYHNLEEDGAYSSLRVAFRAGVDIHSWTAAKLRGLDVAGRFSACVTPEDYSRENEALKEELGSYRKLGKVANLGLQYGMGTQGFLNYCKKNWDVHFLPENAEAMSPEEQHRYAYQEALKLRLQWFDAYPEVELMVLLTEFQKQAYALEPCRFRENGKVVSRNCPLWRTHTLSGRPLIATSKFTALNYPNQGTGSDILMNAVESLRQSYPDTYACTINQVHDELVMEAPSEVAETHAARLEQAILASGERLLSPYGVPMKVETIIADCWQKG
ncbi:DNA polymerase [Acidithiobacillus sp. M4-SHS-6]|uniref:DNA polymerase n=1 Tax=Acidithiobacillus sp. M4-SHS-6 TaxID=3383024 RepID=UPI0039BEC9E9